MCMDAQSKIFVWLINQVHYTIIIGEHGLNIIALACQGANSCQRWITPSIILLVRCNNLWVIGLS